MFDVSTYSNGFGVVLVPFVIGVVLRAVLDTLNAGSTRYMSILLVAFVFCSFSSGTSYAGQVTGTVDSVFYTDTRLDFTCNDVVYNSASDQLSSVLYSAFIQNQEIILIYDDVPLTALSVQIDSNSGLDSKNVSLFLGGVGCLAFSLGFSMRISS